MGTANFLKGFIMSDRIVFFAFVIFFFLSLFFTFQSGYTKGFNEGYESKGYEFSGVRRAFK